VEQNTAHTFNLLICLTPNNILNTPCVYIYKMPIQPDDNKYYDFEELFFEKNCDVNIIITSFFTKYNEDIKGDTEYITDRIKKLIEEDRNYLMRRINENGQGFLDIVGKISYIRHYVIPEKNNGKEYYIYCINSFI